MADASSLLDVEIQCMHEAGIEAPLDLPVKLLQELYPERIVLNDIIREKLRQFSSPTPAVDLFVQNLMEWDYLHSVQPNLSAREPFWAIPAFDGTSILKSRYSSLYFHLRDNSSREYDRKLLEVSLPDYARVLSITKLMQRNFKGLHVRSNDSAQSFFITGVLTVLIPNKTNRLSSNLNSRLDGLREPTMDLVREFAKDSSEKRRNAQVGVSSA